MTLHSLIVLMCR